jgi:hypothetical protein
LPAFATFSRTVVHFSSGFSEFRPLTPEAIVSVILDGIRAREPAASKGLPPC